MSLRAGLKTVASAILADVEPGRLARRIKRPPAARPLKISRFPENADGGSGRPDARPLQQAGRPPLRVLIVPDKFKGTLTAHAAAQAIARGWGRERPHDSLELLPMTDGGDGFGAVMSHLFKARPQRIKTVNAAHRPCVATWWWDAQTKTAIVESAQVIGLAMLPLGKFHPFDLDTFGLGKLLQAARTKGAQQILVGIGGSATNDGGFGLARAVGWKFLAANQKPILQWTELHRLVEIRPPRRRGFSRITVAVDVRNPLLGIRGATRVYGPQKGLRAEDFPAAEKCLRRLATVAHRHFGHDFTKLPGAGAAGGLGFGLLAFLGAKSEPGFELFARQAKLDRHLRAADLVITGEGAIDRSTLMGKGTGEIVRRCRAQRIPCLGLAGCLALDIRRNQLFHELRALTDLTTERQAKTKPADWLERLAELAARRFKTGPLTRRGCQSVTMRRNLTPRRKGAKTQSDSKERRLAG